METKRINSNLICYARINSYEPKHRDPKWGRDCAEFILSNKSRNNTWIVVPRPDFFTTSAWIRSYTGNKILRLFSNDMDYGRAVKLIEN